MKVIDNVVPFLNPFSRHGGGGGGGGRGFAPPFLTSNKMEASFNYTSRGMSIRYPLNSTLDGLQVRSGLCGVQKQSLAPAGNRSPIVSPGTHLSTRYTDLTLKIGSGRLREMLI